MIKHMVEILKINPITAITPDEPLLQKARQSIAQGELIIFPTDTVYGLAADPFNEKAVMSVIKAKQRAIDKGFPVLVANINLAKQLVDFSPNALNLAKQFWPGALTLVLPLKKALPNLTTGYRTSLAIRIPSHPIAKLLAQLPIIGTSANVSGQKPPITADEARAQLGHSVKLILDSGPAKNGKPSTIVDLTGSEPRILREGAIPWIKLRSLLK